MNSAQPKANLLSGKSLIKKANLPLMKRLIQTIDRANFGRYSSNRFIARVAALLEAPVKNGDVVAAYWLAMLHWDAWGIPQDRERAIELLSAAATAGHYKANFNLAIAHDKGIGVVKSHYLSFQFYSRAIRFGCAESMHAIGSFYYWGQGVDQDYASAKRWYRRSAKLGYADAMCDLARCYQRGVGGKKNQHRAIYWFSKAVEAGNIRAHTWIGLEYAKEPLQDWEKARHYLECAAEMQHSHAMYALGIWEEEGWTGKENIADAAFWYKQAVKLGHEKANLKLAKLMGEEF